MSRTNSSDFWDKKHDKYAHEDWVTKPAIFAEQIKKYLPPTGKLLELGCGQGTDAIYFARLGYQVVAIDFSPKSLEYAQKQIPPTLHNQIRLTLLDQAKPLPFNNEFDIVYSHLSLQYFTVKRTHALFHEIYNSLKKSGIFAALFNSIKDPETALFKSLEPDYYLDDDGQAKRYFSPISLSLFTKKFETLLLDEEGETWKDRAKDVHNLIRYVGKKI